MTQPPTNIELVPQELLEEIVGYLNPSNIARLQQCSKLLFYRLEPMFLGRHRHLRRDAMRWACKYGINSLIDRCGANGYPIKMTGSSRFQDVYVKDGRGIAFLALYYGQRGTFSHLVGLGAHFVTDRAALNKLPRGWNHIMLQPLINTLCSVLAVKDKTLKPVVPIMLRDFLEGGHMAQLPRYYRSCALMLILRAATNQENVVEFTRLLLESGADPNFLRLDYPKFPEPTSRSPLGLALQFQEEPVWELLLSHGASIHGPPVPHKMRLPARPLHVPLNGALTAAIDNGGFEWCLRHGADINATAVVRVERGFARACRELRWREPPIRVESQSPLDYYLGGVDWSLSSLAKLPLLFRHGAKARFDLRQEFYLDACMARHSVHDIMTMGWTDRDSPSPIMLLLDTVGVDGLGYPHVLAAICSAFANMPPDEALMRILARYDIPPIKDTVDRTLASDWLKIVDVVISNAQSSDNLSAALSHYILAKGVATDVVDQDERHEIAIGALAHATIRRLVKAGADINYWRMVDGRSYTTFECLCQIYADSYDAPIPGARLDPPHMMPLSQIRQEFLVFLVREFDIEVDMTLPFFNMDPPIFSSRLRKALSGRGLPVRMSGVEPIVC